MPQPLTELDIVGVSGDHLVRAGLVAILAEQPGYRSVAQVGGAEYAAMGSDVLRADVAIWDLGWEPESSIDLVATVSESGHQTLHLCQTNRMPTTCGSPK